MSYVHCCAQRSEMNSGSMRIVKLYSILIFFAMIQFQPVIAEEKSNNEANPKIQAMLNNTFFFELRLINCSEDIGNIINNGVRVRLKGIPHLRLVTPEETMIALGSEEKPVCYDKECAMRIGKIFHKKKVKVDRGIIGSIQRHILTKKEQLASEGEKKYIYELKPYDQYTIKIEVIDLKDSSVIVSLQEKAKKNEVNSKLDELMLKLKEYFKPIMPPKPKKLTPLLGISGSCMVPFSSFRNLINVAGGVNLTVGLKNLFIPNFAGSLNGTYYFVSQKKGSIKEFQVGNISLQLGYSFSLPMKFNITPFLGAGCQIYYIKDNDFAGKILGRENKSRYIDPMATVRCEISYPVYKNLFLTVTPAYTIFFERGTYGNYMNFDLGMIYKFEMPDKTEKQETNGEP